MINKNYHKYNCLAIMMHYRFMGNQSYVMLCSKMTSFQPSEGVGKITIGSIQSRPPWLRLMFRGAWAQGRLVGIFQGEFMFRQNHICVAKVRSMVWSCSGTGCQKHFCIIEYFKVKYMQRCTTALTTHYCLQKKIIFQQK